MPSDPMTPASMLAHLAAHNGIAWGDLDADTARELRAMLDAPAPSSTAAPHSGAEPTVEAGALRHEYEVCDENGECPRFYDAVCVMEAAELWARDASWRLYDNRSLDVRVTDRDGSEWLVEVIPRPRTAYIAQEPRRTKRATPKSEEVSDAR